LGKNIICSVEESAWQLFFVEVVCTFVFVNVILEVKYHHGSSEHVINAATVGTTLFGMITLSGSISGGCVNPAVGLV
jgi:glycerol uptake facilitator-like aquaporin